jgi:hypothetical protein
VSTIHPAAVLIALLIGLFFGGVVVGFTVNEAWEHEAIVRGFAVYGRPQTYGHGGVKFQWKYFVNDKDIDNHQHLRYVPWE